MRDSIQWTPRWTLQKFYNQEEYDLDVPFCTSHFDGNLLLTEGATELLNLLIGETATPFDSTNARLGVGTSSTAANASQTDLLADGVYVALDATYPQVAGAVLTARATFDGTTANQSWQEFCLDNAGVAGTATLNRKVSDQGTKTAGQVWVLTLTITLS